MKARYWYPLLFLLPSAMAAFLAAFMVAGAGAGILWLFVYGDDTWPESAGTMVMAVAVTTSAIILIALVAGSYFFGKSRETTGGLSGWHIAVAVAISVLLPLLVLFHQWQVGNIGGSPVPIGELSKPTTVGGLEDSDA